MIRAAIFDVDGTLLDSMPIWRDAGARYLESVGKTPEQGLSERLFPMSFGEGAAYLKDRYALRETTAEIQAGVSRIIGDFYRREVQPKPGAKAFLEGLRREKVPAVLATTGEPALISAALERLELAQYFERTFTCDALGVTKRGPELYLAAAGYLNAPPEETAVFEDVLHALRAAGGAGFVTVAVEDAQSAADRAEIRACSRIYLRDFLDFDNFWRTAARL